MNKQAQDISLEAFCKNAEALLDLESQITGNAVDVALKKRIGLWKAGYFSIVVMGEIKSGKSSFVNALLEYPDLVPVNSDIATSTIFKIGYGEKVTYKVFFSQKSGKAPQEIEAGQIAAFGTENGNPENEKQVDFILVTCPSPLLQAGLVIVDTPGLGGLFRKHKYITYQYVPQADAVFLVTDGANSPLGKAELDLLADLRKVTKNVFFVQTKSRAIDKDTREMRVQNNLKILEDEAKLAKDDIRLFVVDSAFKAEADKTQDLKKLERSGFAEVSAFMNQTLRPNIHRMVVEKAMPELQPHFANVIMALESQSKLLSADTKEKIEGLKREYDEASEAAERFEREELNKVQDFIEDGMTEINKDASLSLAIFQPISEYSLGLKHRIDNQKTTDCVMHERDAIQQELSEKVAEETFNCLSDIQDKCTKLLETAAAMVKNLTLNGNFAALAWGNVPGIELSPSSDPKNPSTYEKGKAILYGKFAGAGIGGTVGGVIGGIAGSIFPGPGTAAGAAVGAEIGAAIGALFGATKGYGELKDRTLSQMQQVAKNDISLWLTQCGKTIGDAVSSSLGESNKQIKRAVRNGVSQYRDSLKKHSAEIRQREKASTEELSSRRKTLEEWKLQFARIQRVVFEAAQ